MNHKNSNKKDIINNIIYIIFGIYMMTLIMNNIASVMTNNSVEKCIKLVRFSIYAIFIFRILYDWKNGEKVTVPMIIMGSVSILIFICSKNIDILILFIVIVAMRKFKIEKLINIAFYVFSAVFLITVNLALLKIIPDWTYIRNENGFIRHSLGFYYPTITIGLYLSIILMYFYIRKNKCSYLELLILETINIFLYSYTDGRLSFILITLILVAMALSKIKILKKAFMSNVTQKVLKKLLYILPIILFIVAILITVLYINKTSLGLKLDQILSGRLKYTSEAFERYQLTPFGQNIKWNGWGGHGYIEENDFLSSEYNFVDISYARILFDYGIITTILILYMYTKVLIENYNKENYWMCFTLIFVLIWSFVEPYIVYIGKNIFVLTFGIIINNGIEVKALNYEYLKGRIKKENGKEINN